MSEIVPQRPGVPVVMDVDCGHTMPMFTLAQEVSVRVEALLDRPARSFTLEAMVR